MLEKNQTPIEMLDQNAAVVQSAEVPAPAAPIQLQQRQSYAEKVQGLTVDERNWMLAKSKAAAMAQLPAQRLGGFWHTEPLRPFEEPSMILLEQIFTIDKSRMERFMGCAAKTEMLRIDMALLVSLALNVLTGNRGE